AQGVQAFRALLQPSPGRLRRDDLGRARPPARRGRGGPLHLPDAPGGRPRPAGPLPHLRHGARAHDRHRGRGQRRAGRHDPPLLGEPGHDHSRPGPRHGGDGPGRGPPRVARGLGLGAARPLDPGGALGRLALLRPGLGVAREPSPEHVHADRPGHGRRLSLQRCGRPLPGPRPARVSGPRRRGAHLLRGRLDDRDPGPPRPGPGAPGPRPDGGGHQGAPGLGSPPGPHPPRGRLRGRRPARPGPGRRPAPRPARREGPGRRRGGRGPELGRRVDGDRGIDAGREGAGGPAHRRDGQRHGLARHAGRAGGLRDPAVAHRAPGRAGPAEPGPHPEARRCGLGLLRPGRRRHRRPDVRRLGRARSRAEDGLRPGERGGGAHHRLPVRPGPGDPDVHHGRRRPGGPGGRPHQGRRSPRGARQGRHGRGRQDRNPHRGAAEARRGRGLSGSGRGGAPTARLGPGAGERASARRSGRQGRRGSRARPGLGRGIRVAH
ncbi:hypothetical protein HK102_011276, partial [Quaeritorhiza haematococci]